jgi:hypothetical protein
MFSYILGLLYFISNLGGSLFERQYYLKELMLILYACWSEVQFAHQNLDIFYWN